MKKKINIQDTLSPEELEMQTYMDDLMESGNLIIDKEGNQMVFEAARNFKKEKTMKISFTINVEKNNYKKLTSLKNPSQFFEKTLSDALEKV